MHSEMNSSTTSSYFDIEFSNELRQGQSVVCPVPSRVMGSKGFLTSCHCCLWSLLMFNWSVACINWVTCKKWVWENRHWSCGHANG